jgi:hypothetical protein
MALVFSLKEFGRAFATRGRGKELRSSLLARAAGEDVAIIDFTEVTNVSYSFADEFLGMLVSASPENDVPQVEVVNMAAQVDRVVQRAMSRRCKEPRVLGCS